MLNPNLGENVDYLNLYKRISQNKIGDKQRKQPIVNKGMCSEYNFIETLRECESKTGKENDE